jgi:hypothetical protein
MAFRSYDVHLIVNGIKFNKVEIDDHYEEAHADHMDDQIILELVRGLNQQILEPVKEYDDGLKVFVTEPLILRHKPYRLVWFYYTGTHELRVRTAFRTRRRK